MEYYQILRKYLGHQPVILPGSSVVILNENNEVLLQERTDGYWGLPGGLMDLGESFEEVAIREVHEETGLTVSRLKLLSIYSGKQFYMKLDNGDELYTCTAIYLAESYEGAIKISDEESVSLQFYSWDNLPDNLTKNYRYFLEEAYDVLFKKEK